MPEIPRLKKEKYFRSAGRVTHYNEMLICPHESVIFIRFRSDRSIDAVQLPPGLQIASDRQYFWKLERNYTPWK
jgi:hypothetical protein